MKPLTVLLVIFGSAALVFGCARPPLPTPTPTPSPSPTSTPFTDMQLPTLSEEN
jgi:hypothetical protein